MSNEEKLVKELTDWINLRFQVIPGGMTTFKATHETTEGVKNFEAWVCLLSRVGRLTDENAYALVSGMKAHLSQALPCGAFVFWRAYPEFSEFNDHHLDESFQDEWKCALRLRLGVEKAND